MYDGIPLEELLDVLNCGAPRNATHLKPCHLLISEHVVSGLSRLIISDSHCGFLAGKGTEHGRRHGRYLLITALAVAATSTARSSAFFACRHRALLTLINFCGWT